MLHHLPAIVLLLLPCLGHAQDTLPDLMYDHLYFGPAHYENAKDSAEFTRFRAGLKSADAFLPTDATTGHFRMVWQEDQHGGSTMVRRGDGSLLSLPNNAVPPDVFLLARCFRAADGRRGFLRSHETPCGLICRSAWYYVEE
jgi:hypothetical protein